MVICPALMSHLLNPTTTMILLKKVWARRSYRVALTIEHGIGIFLLRIERMRALKPRSARAPRNGRLSSPPSAIRWRGR
jgi:hypothetical protein